MGHAIGFFPPVHISKQLYLKVSITLLPKCGRHHHVVATFLLVLQEAHRRFLWIRISFIFNNASVIRSCYTSLANRRSNQVLSEAIAPRVWCESIFSWTSGFCSCGFNLSQTVALGWRDPLVQYNALNSLNVILIQRGTVHSCPHLWLC